MTRRAYEAAQYSAANEMPRTSAQVVEACQRAAVRHRLSEKQTTKLIHWALN